MKNDTDNKDLNIKKEEKKEETKKISLEELTASLGKENKKLISADELDKSSEEALKFSLNKLENLRQDVACKIEDITAQVGLVKKKLEIIKSSGKIKIDPAEESKSEQWSKQHILLLQNVFHEINQQIQYFSVYLSDKKPEKIIVAKSDPDNFVDYINKRVKDLRKYVKNVQKNLNVIFFIY